jgi:hypothetical protein
MSRLQRAFGIVAAVAVPLLVVWGCNGGGSSNAADAACASPSLPTSGGARIRLANLSTRPGNADFCVRSTGSSGWASPSVFAGGGPSCQSGLSYQQVTIPFATPSGSIDVKTIPAGASCAASATSEIEGVHIGDASSGAAVVTIVRFGGGTTSEALAALPEEPSSRPQGANEHLRIVNALSGGGPINVGVASASTVPATLSADPLAASVPPGQVASGGSSFWSFDSSGYSNLPLTGIPVGVALAGQTSVLLVASTATAADQQTLFAAGDVAASSATERVRGLLCEDHGAPSSTSPLLARCALTALPSLGIDTINVSLYGTDAPFEAARRPYVYKAIAARQTDLMCVLETDRDSDKAGVAQAAKAQFPYSYYAQNTLATQPTDPTTADGGVPPAPTSPPCAGVDPSVVSTAYQCIAQKCTTTGDATGPISTTNCLSEACTVELLPLYQTGLPQDQCFDCMVYHLISGEPVSQGQTACTQQTGQPFAFSGQTTSVMLSRYPLSHQQTFVLPSTGFRVAVLYAQVEIASAQYIDFYCAQLTSPLDDADLPYTGNYGQDRTVSLPDGGTYAENGWQDEQDLQIQKTIAFIQKTSGASGLPAIIAGDWHSSEPVAAPDGGTAVGATSPEVLQALQSAFAQQEPTGYLDACNFCPAPQNPYNGTIQPVDFTHTFLRGFPAGSVTADEFWDTSSSAVPISGIPYEPAPAGGVGPLWEFYPRVFYVVRPSTP